jgi:predicted Zn-dependent protease
MNKQHWIVITGATLLFAVLYFGFDTRNKQQKETSVTRQLTGEVTDFASLLDEAKSHLSSGLATQLSDLERQNKPDLSEAQRVDVFKALSGFWYKAQEMAVAGGYADSVALIENTPAAWSVAGGTYFNALSATADMPVLRKYCGSKAVKAFENAISLAPDDVTHRVNLALVYAENPTEDDPMKAVMMLRELETKHPNAPSVYSALGRLAIKTGQWQRAIERLEKAWSLDKNNPNTPCLLAKAYQETGNTAKYQAFEAICNKR